MARTNRNVQTAPATVTRDAVDLLVEKLNTIEGLAFVRDAWENKAPDDYGVVEMTTQSNALWADDRMVDQIFNLTVHLYCRDGSNAWIAKIQEKLAEAVDWYNMSTHEYLYDIDKNHWTWSVYMIGPMQWEEVASDG